jgi:hypothetical protein
LDYLAFPYKTAIYLTPLNTMIDFQSRRAIVVEGHDAIITLTTVQDLAAVVARAVDYDGEWPMIGGISGNRVPVSRILEIGEKVRGLPHLIRKRKTNRAVLIVSQVIHLLLTRSNWKILRMEISRLRGRSKRATQAFLQNRPRVC